MRLDDVVVPVGPTSVMDVSGQAPTSSSTTTMTSTKRTTLQILCCMCGIPIDPNPSNTCASCLASRTDVTRGISTEATLHQCRGCQRWHRGANAWIGCELESRDLMALCLSNVSGLKSKTKGGGGGDGERGVRLVDASWVWTEPHSMRLKVRLTVQKRVDASSGGGTILQQSFLVTFIVRNQQCVECQAEFRQGAWKSLVQVRQRVSHKRTFLYLEQVILKRGAHRGCLSIETFKDGMDFYFPDKSKAARFISFLENAVPVKVKQSKKLIGMDDKSNVANYKYTNYVEICPLCKDDLLYLPPRVANKLGSINSTVLVKNITALIHIIDPLTGQTASMSPEVYWRQPFRPMITAGRSRLTRYVVLGKEAVTLTRNVSKRRFSAKQKSRVALVTVAKEDDLGVNDVQFVQTSHVGYLLKAGDVCVGYDVKDVQLVDDDAEETRRKGKLPEVVLVRKLYGGVAAPDDVVKTNGSKRAWQLRRLDVDVAEAMKSNKSGRKEKDQEDVDEEDFLREVEADREMRNNMFLYKAELARRRKAEEGATATGEGDAGQDPDDDGEDDDDDDQAVRLEELLDGLNIESGPDGAMAAVGGPEAERGEMAWEEDATMMEEGERAIKEGIGYVGREEARSVQEKGSASAVSGSSFGKDFMGKDFKFT